jgi:hypothetical protein
MMPTKDDVKALRRLGLLNARRADRLRHQYDPKARLYRAKALGFYSEAAALVTAYQAWEASL